MQDSEECSNQVILSLKMKMRTVHLDQNSLWSFKYFLNCEIFLLDKKVKIPNSGIIWVYGMKN